LHLAAQFLKDDKCFGATSLLATTIARESLPGGQGRPPLQEIFTIIIIIIALVIVIVIVIVINAIISLHILPLLPLLLLIQIPNLDSACA